MRKSDPNEWKKKNPERWIELRDMSKKSLILRRQEAVRQYKERPCADCRVQYPHYKMQFDHKGGRDDIYSLRAREKGKRPMSIALMLRKVSLENLMKELAKCDIVCSNCHSGRTYRRSHPEEFPVDDY